MSEAKFEPGEYVIYQNGDGFEVRKLKRICDDGAFVWYSGGETARTTQEVQLPADGLTEDKLAALSGAVRVTKGASKNGTDNCKRLCISMAN